MFWSFGGWTGVRPLLTDQKRGFPPQKPTFLRHFAVFFNSFLRKVRFHHGLCSIQLFSVFLSNRLFPIFSRLYRHFSRPFREQRIAPFFFFPFFDWWQLARTLRLERQGLFSRSFLSCSIMFTPLVLFVQIFPRVRELFVLDDALFSGLSYSIFPKRHQMGDAFLFFPSFFCFSQNRRINVGNLR